MKLDEIKKNPEVKMLLTKSDRYLGKIGFTEHGFKHAEISSKRAKDMLLKLYTDHKYFCYRLQHIS